MENTNLFSAENPNMDLSIVVPVYNSQKFLDNLFTSLLDQDIDEDSYEIICVNDGSTDRSPEILQSYADKHRCIKIITQENKGQSAARNVGLLKSVGRYVWFVDSDDFIDTDCLQFIVSSMDENNIDELTVGLKILPGDAEYHSEKKSFQYNELKKHNGRATCSGVKVFRRALLADNNISWNGSLSLCDDVLFLYQFELFSRKNISLNAPVYYYRYIADSTSHAATEETLNKHMYSLVQLGDIYREIKKSPPKELTKKQIKELDDRISLCTQTVLYDVALKGDKVEQEEFLKKFKENGQYPYKAISSNLRPKISFQRTLYDFLMYFFPNEKMYRLISGTMKKLRDKKINK